MADFAVRVRDGEWLGYTGRRIRNVVNIGIGGSDLGPAMATEALRDYSDRSMRFRFVSNVDGTDLREAIIDLDPAETLFIVVEQDLHDARDDDQRDVGARLAAGRARRRRGGGRAPLRGGEHQRGEGPRVRHRHGEHVRVLGLGRRPVLDGLRDRAVADDRDRARRLPRACSRASTTMDEHFRTAPLEQNLPVLMALLGIWYGNFFGFETPCGPALQPGARPLPGLPPAARHGVQRQVGPARRHAASTYATGPIVWGTAGTNGQHAYYQLLHQGTHIVPADLIGFVNPHDRDRRPPRPADGEPVRPGRGVRVRQDARGGRGRRACPTHQVDARVFEGNRPDVGDPRRQAHAADAGHPRRALRAQGVRAGRRSGASTRFDQWGVELGKVLATRIAGELDAAEQPVANDHDSSTAALIRRYRTLRRRA